MTGIERLHPWLPVLSDRDGRIRVGRDRRPLPAHLTEVVRDSVRRLRDGRQDPGAGRQVLAAAGHVLATADLTATAARGGDPLARAHLTREAVTPGAGARVRRRRPVTVLGPATLAAPLQHGLAECGCAGPQPGDLVVHWGTPNAALRYDWMGDGVPHLVVSPRAGSVRVGPLVVPGRTPCLHCLDLSRRDGDPSWPELSRQLRARALPQPDPALVLAATGVALGVVTRWLETGDDATCRGYWEVDADSPIPAWQSVQRHPECGCWWPDPPPAAPAS